MKLSLLVLFGGESNEHEVSLRSAAAVIKNADKEKYDIIKIGITKSGEWNLYNGPVERIASGEWESDVKNLIHVAILPKGDESAIIYLNGTMKQVRPDVIFPVLHGQNCEDGKLQGVLELLHVPYVGCKCFSSALCMDKSATKLALKDIDIPMAKWIDVKADSINDAIIERIENELSYPVFVKPSNSGSSVGVSKAENRERLIDALKLAASVDEKILVEEYIQGREVEVAVLDGLRTLISGTGEIEPCSEFYDYDTKYKTDVANYYMPARISSETEAKIRAYAEKIFRALDCDGLSRVDFFVTHKDERIVFNEINTLPGFTSISMYPKLMEKAGLSFSALIDELIGGALGYKVL
ncbi:MAG: D-alanine--D-alanine ligase [Clostridia bacterium]|nr:D-alanine--D-alanine ligase [Clostridia bacterium]